MKTIVATLMAILMVILPMTADAKTSAFVDLMSRADSQHCIASAVYYEALGESREGKIAVASVIMNRIKSGRYPSTPCAVIYQRGQFSWINPRYRTHVYDLGKWQESLEISRLVLEGSALDNTNGALFFHNKHVHPSDTKARRIVAVIGQHVFVK